MQKCDTTRLDQQYHDDKLFEETIELLKRFYGDRPSRSSTVISSNNVPEVLSDYFKDAKFTRG